MRGRDLLKKLHEGLEITPITLRYLLYLKSVPCDVHTLFDGAYDVVLKKGDPISIEQIKKLMTRGHGRVFIHQRERENLTNALIEQLILVSRALSIGDTLDNVKRIMALLTIHLELIYEEPHNDELLQIETSCLKNLAHVIMENPEFIKPLYDGYQKQKHYYIYAQPMISSLFLLGFLKYMRVFSVKEMESLFLTSFYKDVGMSIIPFEKFEKNELTEDEKRMIADHPSHSCRLLEGRVGLSSNFMHIIKHHHAFSLIQTSDVSKIEGYNALSGFETMIVSTMDIIAAKTSDRPYRSADEIFPTLELIKNIVSDRFPSEFRLLVLYFKNIF